MLRGLLTLLFSEIVEQKEDKMINKKMEALVSTLASQYALSPGGVRTLIRRTMDTEQVIYSNSFKLKW